MARRAHTANLVGLAGLHFASPVPNLTTGAEVTGAEWFLTQLAKVGLLGPFPLSISKPTDNK